VITSNSLALWLSLILTVIAGTLFISDIKSKSESGIAENASNLEHHREVIDLKLGYIVKELKEIKAQTARD